MNGISRESANLFRVRFREIGKAGLRGLFGRRFFQVDPHLIGQTIIQVMRLASMRSASGKMLVWNDYRVIVHPSELEPLRALQGRIQSDLATVVAAEVQRLEGEMVGDLCVRLIADEGNQLAPGEGMIRVAFVDNQRIAADVPGEVTVRVDAAVLCGEIKEVLARQPIADPTETVLVEESLRVPEDFAGGFTLEWPGGSKVIPYDIHTVVGRPHTAAPANFVPLAGASGKINKQQLWLVVRPGLLTVGRFSHANPVAVDGTPLAPGQSTQCASPDLSIELSRGDLCLRLRRIAS